MISSVSRIVDLRRHVRVRGVVCRERDRSRRFAAARRSIADRARRRFAGKAKAPARHHRLQEAPAPVLADSLLGRKQTNRPT